MTSAPRLQSSCVQNGPGRRRVKSIDDPLERGRHRAWNRRPRYQSSGALGNLLIRRGPWCRSRNEMPEAVIVEAVRTPIGKRGGSLKEWRPDDLAAFALR